ADSASCPGQERPPAALHSPGQRWEMAPVLPLVLPSCPASIWHRGSGSSLGYWGWPEASPFSVVGISWSSCVTLTPSWPPPVAWQLVSGSGHRAVGCGSQQDQSGCGAVPSLARRLGPSLVAGAAGGGWLLVLTLGLTCCCLEAGRWPKEGLGTALLTTRTQKGPDTYAKWLLDELQLWHHCCGHHGDKDSFGVQVSCNLDPGGQDVVNLTQSNLEGLYLIHGVPFPCCEPHLSRLCLQNQFSAPHTHPFFGP
ncbi:LOW QUALITY PROTEIN: Rod outer segment membrane protein 1, partial [Galemys pyrenaicus]